MRLSILFLLLPSIGLSQQVINADQFFSLGLSGFEPIGKPTAEQLNFPWIDKYEFRTETRDFEPGKQEYTFRISPSTAGIRRAQRAYYEEMRNAPDFDGQEIYCDYVLSLHMDWLSLFMLHENQNALNELAVLLKDKQTIYERMAGTYDVDPEKLLKLQTEKSELEMAMNKLRQERGLLFQKYPIQNQEIDFGHFITLEAISDFLANNILSANESAMMDSKTTYKKQLLVREMELESSENKRLVDFLQLKYTGPHTDALQERLSVGLGIQLSNSGSKKLKMQELKMELDQLEQQSKRDIQLKQSTLLVFERELQADIQAFFHFQKTMEEEQKQLESLSSGFSQKEGVSPLFLLEIEERRLSMKIKALGKKERLLKDYLMYLQESGKMCQPTFVNYLAP